MKDDKFNFTHVALTERGFELGGTRGQRRIGNVSESLDHFRTVAFGIEVMRDTIESERVTSSIEAGTWYEGVVPECYRPAAIDAMTRAFEPYRGRKLVPDTVRAFIDDLNREIWATVEPIAPGEVVEPPLPPAMLTTAHFVGSARPVEEPPRCERCSETPASCAVCDLPTCMGCRRRAAAKSEERKTGVVACSGCDPDNLFAMGRPAVFIVLEDDYDSSRTVSAWSTRSAAQAEIERLNAAGGYADYHIEGELVRSPEDVRR